MTSEFIRRALAEDLSFIGITEQPADPWNSPRTTSGACSSPTPSIRSGVPPHIAQVIVGHTSINTTMGYNAVYPTKTIEAHRAFIARRRALRPAEGNRTPAGTEWEDFLGRFERRKLSESSPHASRLRRSPRVTSRECPRGLRGR
jgi:hypothetical protein